MDRNNEYQQVHCRCGYCCQLLPVKNHQQQQQQHNPNDNDDGGVGNQWKLPGKTIIIIIWTIIQCWWLLFWKLLSPSSSSSSSSLLFILRIFIFFLLSLFLPLAFGHRNSNNHHHPNLNQDQTSSKIVDLVVNLGENVLLECTDDSSTSSATSTSSSSLIFGYASSPFQYVWCRFEQDYEWSEPTKVNDDEIIIQNDRSSNQSLLYNNNGNDNKSNNHNNNNHNHNHNGTILKQKTCFEGDQYLIVNENHISTVIYHCEVRRKKSVQNSGQSEGWLVKRKLFKLYVDQFPKTYKVKRAIQEFPISAYGRRSRRCRAPRCKPYATVKYAHCSRIELQVRYPSDQYGYNHSIDHWGTIYCNDHIMGYQLWLIGYGIVKKFLPNDPIILDNLIPGKRYCFNGWAYNSCGPGPVFTLEGVCAKNSNDCHSPSDEHCELDLDYSW